MTNKIWVFHINFRAFHPNLVSIDVHMTSSLESAIRDIPDFPKPGIIFKDITPILSDPALFQYTIDLFVNHVADQNVEKVVGIDARGFIFGAPVALALGAGFVPLRKQGKLPAATYSESYSLEYGEDAVEIHRDAIAPGERVLLIDDLLATGGTASAAMRLLNKLGADVVSVSFLIELAFLGGRSNISSNKIHSILSY